MLTSSKWINKLAQIRTTPTWALFQWTLMPPPHQFHSRNLWMKNELNSELRVTVFDAESRATWPVTVPRMLNTHQTQTQVWMHMKPPPQLMLQANLLLWLLELWIAQNQNPPTPNKFMHSRRRWVKRNRVVLGHMGYGPRFLLCWTLKVADSAHIANMYSTKDNSIVPRRMEPSAPSWTATNLIHGPSVTCTPFPISMTSLTIYKGKLSSLNMSFVGVKITSASKKKTSGLWCSKPLLDSISPLWHPHPHYAYAPNGVIYGKTNTHLCLEIL